MGTILDSVLQRASFAVVVHSADLDILEWNAGAESLFGFTAGEAIGKKIPALLGRKSIAVRKDGQRINCQWQEESVEGGKVLAIVSDVTHAKTRERLLQVLLDNLKVVVWQTNTKGTFTFHDGKKGLENIGLKPGQVLGMNVFDLYRDSGSDVVTGALEGKPTIAVNEAYGRAWESYTLPLYDEEQHIDGVVGVTLDVTESTEREKELRAKLSVIEQQQQMISELSIPMIETWHGVLTVPMVGVVDRTRASEVMERLLTEITRRKARFAIIDLTGVEEIDTEAAAHIIGLVRAIQLLGAKGIVTGIRPTMAQAMVQLGVDLSGIRTLANLREALGYCIGELEARAEELIGSSRMPGATASSTRP